MHFRPSEKAVAMHKELAGENPGAFNPELASSLHGLSMILSDVGLKKDAIHAIREAVQMYQILDSQLEYPNIFHSKLTRSLEVLSNMLTETTSDDEFM